MRALVRSALVVGLALALPLSAQAPTGGHVRPGSPAPDQLAAPVPFGPGERFEFQVKLGMFSAVSGFMEVAGVDTVRGRPAYRLAMNISGGMLFAKVNDKYQSWLDTRALNSLHFISDVKEVGYKSFREFAIYPEEKRWQQLDENRAETMDTDAPLDELSYIYWLRTMPLQVGDTYTVPRYFQRSGNPVVIRVVRKEVKEVPAGTFNTIVVQPIIQTKGLFSQGGEAEIFLTDDADRQLVYLRSKIPVVGSVTLHLRRVVRGTPLNARWTGAPTDPVAGSAQVR